MQTGNKQRSVVTSRRSAFRTAEHKMRPDKTLVFESTCGIENIKTNKLVLGVQKRKTWNRAGKFQASLHGCYFSVHHNQCTPTAVRVCNVYYHNLAPRLFLKKEATFCHPKRGKDCVGRRGYTQSQFIE